MGGDKLQARFLCCPACPATPGSAQTSDPDADVAFSTKDSGDRLGGGALPPPTELLRTYSPVPLAARPRETSVGCNRFLTPSDVIPFSPSPKTRTVVLTQEGFLDFRLVCPPDDFHHTDHRQGREEGNGLEERTENPRGHAEGIGPSASFTHRAPELTKEEDYICAETPQSRN